MKDEMQELAIDLLREYVDATAGREDPRAFFDALTMIISVAASGITDKFDAFQCSVVLAEINEHMRKREAKRKMETVQ